MPKFLRLVSFLLFLGPSSCVLIYQTGEVEETEKAELRPGSVAVPMKAFLLNGDVVVYADGADISPDAIFGPGLRYPLNRKSSVSVEVIPLDSVVGIEAFRTQVNSPGTILLTTLGSGAALIGVTALAKAIFGSCPTFYTSPEAGATLQAESFSYSIAAELERQDLDRVSLRPDPDGLLRLELRNEALETHYINHLGLVAVEHAPDVQVLPEAMGGVVAVRDPIPPGEARDRDGRSVLREVLATDGLVFTSTETRIAAATSQDSRDFLELTFDRPAAKEAVLALNLRNSLLNTVLYYDLMLSATGVRALNWWGGNRENIEEGIEMAHWYVDYLGLRVEVHGEEGWEPVARVLGIGPIAWKDLGVRIPVPADGPVRIRLSFLPDDWRIEEVALAAEVQPINTREIPVHGIVPRRGEDAPGALQSLASGDQSYLVTYPGTSAMLEFLPAEPEGDNAITYLLASQGYYIEWMRPAWIRTAWEGTLFQPGHGAVETLMARWLEKKPTMEEAFFGSRIPVR